MKKISLMMKFSTEVLGTFFPDTMSFLNSIQQLVSGAGQSINAGARKLVSSLSQDSASGSEIIVTPNIEVSSEDFASGKRPTG